MNRTNRSKVINYFYDEFGVHLNYVTDLSFYTVKYVDSIHTWVPTNSSFLENLNLSDQIINCLRLTEYNYSREPSDENLQGKYDFQCTPGRYRSVIDIWRHLKKYNKDLEIFDVMREMYNISDKLEFQYCCTVDRRVFWLFYPDDENDHDRPYQEFDEDEFGLCFDEWRDI